MAIKIRSRQTKPGSKYVYLSSRSDDRPESLSPGSPVHVPLGVTRETVTASGDVLRVTEGPLKADVATVLSQLPTIAAPSAGEMKKTIETAVALGATTVRIAVDTDASTNKAVARGLVACVQVALGKGLTVEIERWPIDAGKGIDDILAAGQADAIQVLTGDAAQAAASEILAAAERAEAAKPKETADETDGETRSTGLGDGKHVITNASIEQDEEGKKKTEPLAMKQIMAVLAAATDGWPRRVGSALFVCEHGEVSWLESPAALFGWAQTCTGVVQWHRGQGYATKEECYAELRRTAPAYVAVESMPHVPPLAGHFYSCDTPQPGDGSAIAGLLDRFKPATDIDRDLMLAAIVTPFWGGSGGSRPAFVITSDSGRGVGKTRFATMCGHLAGGLMDFSANDDITEIKQRLLSPDAAGRRLALLDNVKSSRFSWSELEAILTSPTISGKRMYVGEASRPNTITWFITLNGPALSPDMSQRSILIKLDKPNRTGDWEEETTRYVLDNRQRIIADIVAFLGYPAGTLSRFTRWASWERDVLSKLPEPSDAQKIIEERQAVADVEVEEIEIIREFFQSRLRGLRYDTDRDRVLIPSSIVAKWYNRATNENRSVSTVSRSLVQLCDERKPTWLARNTNNAIGRGFLWIGGSFNPMIGVETDLEARVLAADKEANMSEADKLDRARQFER